MAHRSHTSTPTSPSFESRHRLASMDQAKVAFVPGEAFGLGGYARFSFALGDDDISEGVDRFASLVS